MTGPHDAAPTDADGHPVHPEEGYRICGRTKSDQTTPTEHGRERDEYPYCLQRAGWGVDDADTGACKAHGGSGGGPTGPANGNWKHGAFSSKFRESLSEDEEEALDDLQGALADPEQADAALREIAAELFLKYRRSNDTDFVREARKLLSEFNVVDATDHVEHHGDLEMSADDKAQLEALLDREVQS